MTSADVRTGARTIPLPELVDLAWSGRIRVPHFQRDFRWGRADVIQLMDSVLKGYPIGSLLLWERPAPAQRLRLGAMSIDAPAVDNALWVVDGQQRVTSLANVLTTERSDDLRFNLGFDLKTASIVPLPTIEDPQVIPLPVMFDLSAVLEWFAEHPESGQRERDIAFGFARALHQLAIPAYQVVHDDVSVLQNIFDRMNNSGKRLSRAEVFSALNAGTEEDSETGLSLQRIAEDIDEQMHFGRIDDDTILQCVLARRGPDTRREIRSEFDPQRRGAGDFPDEGREEAYERGRDALEKAVRYVIRAGVPHFTMLPYRYLLVVLTRFLAHNAELRPANERLLDRWFWRAAVAGPYIIRGGTTSIGRTLTGKIDPVRTHESLIGLLAVVGEAEREAPDPDRFRTNEAAAKIILCHWWSLGPRRPDTGEEYTRDDLASAIGASSTAADAVPAIFGRSAVPASQSSWAANRAIMPVLDEATPHVSELLQRRPVGISNETWRAVLDSHAITPDIEAALQRDDVPEFLRLRQQLIVDNLASFLRRRCEWGFEHTPPLDQLVIDDQTGDDAS
ncbi:DUF262 domain-containing protein [Skermania piniformis]|uniref:DUF262 domain-containing protein n=1 Tax=Skermania pinensis TaxID=39122 RepID=A0ABX8S8A8_9ACTN|nr:DUF262 domain-containing protein [Skermania piniformis]QXQ13521.1 DUF262 domain-containing protein [Skermania piniformis]